MVFFLSGPDWKFYFLNSKSKKCYTSGFHKGLEFESKCRVFYLAFTENPGAWVKTTNATVLGTQAQRWRSEDDKRSSLIQWQECVTLPHTVVSRELLKALTTFYGMPDLGQLPLRYVYFGKPTVGLPMMEREVDPSEVKPKLQTWMDTISIEHKNSLDPALFTVPKGYATATKMSEVMMRTMPHGEFLKDLMSHPEEFFQSR